MYAGLINRDYMTLLPEYDIKMKNKCCITTFIH